MKDVARVIWPYITGAGKTSFGMPSPASDCQFLGQGCLFMFIGASTEAIKHFVSPRLPELL